MHSQNSPRILALFADVDRCYTRMEELSRLPDDTLTGAVPTVSLWSLAQHLHHIAVSSAHMLKRNGAHLLRGGAYKPRSSPYDFQGLGREGLEMLSEAGRAAGLPIVT